MAGLPEPGLHSFRRAFALLSLRTGNIDLDFLRRMMGHSDLSIIDRYLAQTTDDLKRVHDRSSPVDNFL